MSKPWRARPQAVVEPWWFTSKPQVAFSQPWTRTVAVPWVHRQSIAPLWGAASDPNAITISRDTVSQIASIYSEFATSDDPRVQAAKLRTQINSMKAQKRKYPLLGTILDARIASSEAQLAVLEQQAATLAEGEDATRTWRVLGMSGAAVGIIAGVAFTGLLLVAAQRVRSK